MSMMSMSSKIEPAILWCGTRCILLCKKKNKYYTGCDGIAFIARHFLLYYFHNNIILVSILLIQTLWGLWTTLKSSCKPISQASHKSSRFLQLTWSCSITREHFCVFFYKPMEDHACFGANGLYMIWTCTHSECHKKIKKCSYGNTSVLIRFCIFLGILSHRTLWN